MILRTSVRDIDHFGHDTERYFRQNIKHMAQQTLSHVSHIGEEHRAWNRGIAFYQDEIQILLHRLEEVSQRNTAEEIRKQVEHFENQWNIQSKQWSELSSAIQSNTRHISDDAMSHAQHLTTETLAEIDAMRDRYVTAERIYQDLRNEFNRFLIHNL
jgi:hypothetical protein